MPIINDLRDTVENNFDELENILNYIKDRIDEIVDRRPMPPAIKTKIKRLLVIMSTTLAIVFSPAYMFIKFFIVPFIEPLIEPVIKPFIRILINLRNNFDANRRRAANENLSSIELTDANEINNNSQGNSRDYYGSIFINSNSQRNERISLLPSEQQRQQRQMNRV